MIQLTIEMGNLPMTELLLTRKADPNHQNLDGDTALHYAVRTGVDEGVNLLLRHGAVANIHNKFNETCLHAAAYRGDHATVRHLMYMGAFRRSFDLL